MILSIKVSDEVYEQYGRHNNANPRGAIEAVVNRFAEVGASGKAVVLSGENLKQLQALVGQIDSPEALIELIRKAVSARVDGVEFPLSESQRKGIKDRAAHQGQPADMVFQREVTSALRNALGI